MFETVAKTMRLALFSSVVTLQSAVSASAYQVDCAILLCLSGGWPASAPCAHARAVFIRRITPWPIEPPLQIWRCPMRAAMNSAPGGTPGERLFAFAFADAPMQSTPDSPDPTEGQAILAVLNRSDADVDVPAAFLHLAQEISTDNGTADIDISGSEFDFVRSIKVWNVMHYSHVPRGRDDDCSVRSSITLGTYGVQGNFEWQGTSPAPVPHWVIPSQACDRGNSVRAVGIEWTDFQGNHGHEVVRY
ncbi:MAG: hypothetical protein O3C57_03715 [Verrucomicrobia bacterium]|nr:hypothetical protein [Verrucomicrobiota bacterium]